MTGAARPWIWSFFFSLIYVANAHATASVELNYVSPETKQQLQKAFETARAAIDESLAQDWNCELFGVRSGLQHEKNLPLYAFNSSSLINRGIGPTKTFHLNKEKTELSGSTEKVEERVRMINKKMIVAKISQAQSHHVLAYAKCSPAKSI